MSNFHNVVIQSSSFALSSFLELPLWSAPLSGSAACPTASVKGRRTVPASRSRPRRAQGTPGLRRRPQVPSAGLCCRLCSMMWLERSPAPAEGHWPLHGSSESCTSHGTEHTDVRRGRQSSSLPFSLPLTSAQNKLIQYPFSMFLHVGTCVLHTYLPRGVKIGSWEQNKNTVGGV